MADLMVNVNVICKTEQEAVQAFEVLSRMAVGLALGGLYASASITQIDDNEDKP